MSKILALDRMVAEHIADGDTIFVGGFGQNVPFAIGAEVIRQKRRNLTLCRTGADILFDLMIAAGAVQKVIVGWIGNPGIGLNHAFTRALASGELELEESSNFSVLLRLMAGGLGIPFVPTRTLTDGDIVKSLPSAQQLQCPFTNEPVIAIQALKPDVAIVHVQRADRFGNLQSWGVLGETAEGVTASRKVIATAEEIVEPEVIRANPGRTFVPGWRVAAVAEVPLGAYPSYCQGYYGRDDDFYRQYDQFSRSADELTCWIKNNVTDTVGWPDFLKTLESDRIRLSTQAPNSSTAARQ